MKKFIAIAMAAVIALSMAACGAVNKTPVSILWSGDGEVKAPNSLINAMERAMYIENITYQHYGANGDQAAQTQQAQAALDAGSAALLVELVDPAAAQSLVDLAKAKEVPIVFFNCAVEETVISGYDKCALVTTDEESLADSYSKMISAYIEDNTEKDGTIKLDLDGDGKVSYVVDGDVAVTPAESMLQLEAAVEELQVTTVEEEKKSLFGTKTEEMGRLTTPAGAVVEMILQADDAQTLQTLVTLQEAGMNSDKLTTHFVPVFTVGADADYKGYVLQNMPADQDKAAYLEKMLHLVDLTGIDESEWAEKTESMIYNTLNQCDAGKLVDTVIEDYDAVATAAAGAVKTLLKGETVSQTVTKIPYISYAA